MVHYTRMDSHIPAKDIIHNVGYQAVRLRALHECNQLASRCTLCNALYTVQLYIIIPSYNIRPGLQNA